MLGVSFSDENPKRLFICLDQMNEYRLVSYVTPGVSYENKLKFINMYCRKLNHVFMNATPVCVVNYKDGTDDVISKYLNTAYLNSNGTINDAKFGEYVKSYEEYYIDHVEEEDVPEFHKQCDFGNICEEYDIYIKSLNLREIDGYDGVLTDFVKGEC